MPWDRPPEILTNDVYCPYCSKHHIKKRFACKRHNWSYRKWYEALG